MVDVKFAIEPLTEYEVLAIEWRDLESRSDGSFFTSWPWIGTWLQFASKYAQLFVCRGFDDDELVALGVLARATATNRSGARLLLHAADHPGLDSTYVELNGLLFSRRIAVEPIESFVKAIQGADCIHGWKELMLPGVTNGASYFQCAINSGYLAHHVAHDAPCIDLQSLARNQAAYEAAIDKKGRYQFRRACRDYERELGAISVVRAATTHDAIEMFAQLEALHTKTWRARGTTGAFALPEFAQFHRALIRDYFDEGLVDLLRVSCGDSLIGVLYVLCHRGHACLYQTGYNYHALKSGNQPGYLCVPVAVLHYLERDFRVFDFLAGEAAYKRRLANSSRSLSWLTIEQATLTARAKRVVRQFKRALSAGNR